MNAHALRVSRRGSWLAVGFLLFSLAGTARAVSVEQIPDPRPAGYVVDLTATLAESSRQEINQLGSWVQQSSRGELAVVVVDTLDGREPREATTALFNRWGLGDGRRNDGVLLLVALGDRAVEIVLGDGIDNPNARAVSQEIIDGELLPHLRAGDPEAAILAGARACAGRLLGLPPAEGLADPALAQGTTGGAPAVDPGVPWQGATSAPPAPAAPLEPRRSTLSSRFGLLAAVGGALLVAALAGGLLFWLWRKSKHCRSCGSRWQVLPEHQDDAFLHPAQQTEERIGAVNYDVLQCPGCGAREIRRRARWFSRFRQCPKCHATTVQVTTTVVSPATQFSSGQERVQLDCAHCAFTETQLVTTPRIVPRSHVRSASTSRWSSGSGSGFSGGGRSSGGGASGRW